MPRLTRDLFALFVHSRQTFYISTNTERRAGLSTIADLFVEIPVCERRDRKIDRRTTTRWSHNNIRNDWICILKNLVDILVVKWQAPSTREPSSADHTHSRSDVRRSLMSIARGRQQLVYAFTVRTAYSDVVSSCDLELWPMTLICEREPPCQRSCHFVRKLSCPDTIRDTRTHQTNCITRPLWR